MRSSVARGAAARRTLLLLLLLVGCSKDGGRTLRPLATVPLADAAAGTLAIDSAGRWWLGLPGAVRVRSDSGIAARIPVGGSSVPGVLGWVDGAAYLHLDGRVLVVSPGGDSVGATRGGFGDNPLLLGARGERVLQGARSGAVLAHDAATLEPIWAWAALGARSTALAGSPQGDRIYHVLGMGDDRSRILTRDLQTGRVLAATPVSFRLDRLVAGRSGRLYGIGRDGGRVLVVAYDPRGGELTEVWRTALRGAEEDAELGLAVGAEVAVWGLGARMGLRLLDPGDGSALGRTRTEPLDASFGPAGELWALYPAELRRLR